MPLFALIPRGMRAPSAPPRRGAALIIAIAVLAALMFLALPFLYSQSASVAGARAGSWDGTARRAQGTAEGIAAAAAIYATGLSRTPALQLASAVSSYTALPGQIANILGIYAVADTAFRTILETDKAWTDPAAPATVLRAALDDPARLLYGAVIEDEGRRLDPNGLGERAWAVILKRAGVPDPYTIRWDFSTPRNPGGAATDPFTYGDWKMYASESQRYGRLARALAHWRPANSGMRFAELADLLGADPQAMVGADPDILVGNIPFYLPYQYYNSAGSAVWPVPRHDIEATRPAAESDVLLVKAADPSQAGYRTARLTQVELERLRPYLTFHALGQGRGGLTDLATVIAVDPAAIKYVVLTDLPDPVGLKTGANYWQTGAWIRDAAGRATFATDWVPTTPVGAGLAMDVAPTLSINAIPASSSLTLLYSPPDTLTGEPTAGTVFGPVPPSRPAWPFYPDQAPLTALDQVPLLRWLDPRAGDGSTVFERPALGLGGWGVVTIEGSATALDPSGRAQAQRRRRIIMQTVPQEHPVEAAWSTQAELEALIRQRHGSWIVAGPQPTNRIANWGGDATDMPKLARAGWIEPAPVCAFSENPVVAFDWKAPFGLTGAVAWGSVLNAPQPPQLPAAAQQPQFAKDRLTAQGLRLEAGDQLAWTVDAGQGPLRFGANGAYQELTTRHVSLRFCFPQAPGDAVILEARAQNVGADTTDPADGTADAKTEFQSVWRVEYRAADEMLVLVLANAALPWTAADRTRFGITNAWTTGSDVPGAAEDARCSAGSLPFAPADPGTRVEFRYKVKDGLVGGRWYHLQAFCASDRPGLHGLILDGLVGRDAIAADAFTETGDHYTFPSLRLATAIAATDPASDALALGTPGSIQVALPSGQTIGQLLPERGLVRIDDEFFSYTSLAGTTLAGVQRARRINTDQGATTSEDVNGNLILDPGEDTNGNSVIDLVASAQCWPVTQAHAQGALVTPGWGQSPLTTGPWLRGSCLLAQAFPTQPASGTLAPPGGGWPDANTNGLLDFNNPAVVTLATTTGTWPSRGYVRFDVDGAMRRAAFENTGGTLTLEWSGPAILGGLAEFAAGNTVACRVVSLEVSGAITDPGSDASSDGVSDRLFADSGAVQLLSTTDGACEWIRIQQRADRDGGTLTVAGRYFLRDDGWQMPSPTPTPLTQSRGAMRTPWRQTDWPVGTMVLPVQNLLANTDRFESGDVVTVVSPVANRAPVQLVIRHAARDGYPGPAAVGAANDTSNEWFALTHRVPDAVPDPQSGAVGVVQMALIGRGWSGDDLSTIGNDRPRRGALPMLRLLTGSASARLFVGCPEAGATASVILDDLCAGTLPGPTDANADTPQADILEINDAAFGAGAVILGTAGQLPVRVRSNAQVFVRPYGLALIDGEVFAWRKDDPGNTYAKLIARGLLGSTRLEHRLAPAVGPTVPGRGSPIQPTLPIVILPLGPVAELCSALPTVLTPPAGADVLEADAAPFYQDPEVLQFRGQTAHASAPTNLLRAPFQLIADPEGGAVELVKLYKRPASAQCLAVPWLRGLYGTAANGAGTGTPPLLSIPRPVVWDAAAALPVVTWPAMGAGTANPIVLGWWPRFAPGVPENVAGSDLGAQLRSRVFAWAGFALRLHGARFDPGIEVLKLANGGITDITVEEAAGCQINARALAAGTNSTQIFDWENAVSVAAGSPSTGMFNWSRFQNREVDGAELRIHWSPPVSGGLEAVAANQGLAPRLGADDTQALVAPAGTAAVRLRCVAPTRILAIEEVR